jgi:hypothetical protein
LEAIKQSSFGLPFDLYRFKDDRDIVSEAVKINGYALKFASSIL